MKKTIYDKLIVVFITSANGGVRLSVLITEPSVSDNNGGDTGVEV